MSEEMPFVTERKRKAKEDAYGALLGNNLYYHECCEVLEGLLEHFRKLTNKCDNCGDYFDNIAPHDPIKEFVGKGNFCDVCYGHFLNQAAIKFDNKIKSYDQEKAHSSR